MISVRDVTGTPHTLTVKSILSVSPGPRGYETCRSVLKVNPNPDVFSDVFITVAHDAHELGQMILRAEGEDV
ncbi:MAG: hypothetical protein COA62_15760 [Rhodobiaceae bacterium]|nr:MAG: hypothetical protein COA62_15760 [Rhodobiaceae bacterium]